MFGLIYTWVFTIGFDAYFVVLRLYYDVINDI